MGLADIVKGFKKIFSKTKPVISASQNKRVIIEDGLYNDWEGHSCSAGEYPIPANVTRIVSYNGTLDLVGRLGEGLCEDLPAADAKTYTLPSSGFSGLKPRILIVEDKRVYFDKTLQEQFLSRFLQQVNLRGFENIYDEGLRAKQGRAAHG